MDNTDTQVLIVQIVCGGTGLNLQQYNVALFTSPTWNPSLEDDEGDYIVVSEVSGTSTLLDGISS